MGSNVHGLPADRFESRPLRDQPALQLAPQRNGQAPSQRYNADAPHALTAMGEASRKPLAQLALGLVAQLALPARVGRGYKPQATRHFASVSKVPPTKQLLRQHPAAAHPDAA